MREAAKRSATGSNRRRLALSLALAALLVVAVLATNAASAAAPTVTVEPASEIGVTSALAEGSVNPEGEETNCRFDYITDAQFEANTQNSAPPFEGAAEAPCTGNPLTGTGAQPVQAVLTGLTPGTVYHLRLVAVNSQSESAEETAPNFETDAANVPTVAVTGTSSVKYTEAHLEGTINPNGGNTNPLDSEPLRIDWALEFAPKAEPEPRNWQSANLTSTNPIEGANAGSSSPLPIEAWAINLQNGTEYVFRLVAIYAGGLRETSPSEGTFTTLTTSKPTVTGPVVSELTSESAKFSGEVDPGGSDPTFTSDWHFECTPECRGLVGGTVPAGASGDELKVEAQSDELDPNTSYTVRLIASNAAGSEEKSEAFKTPLSSGPLVISFQAGPVTPTTAELNAEIAPRGSETTYWFEWGTTDCASNPCAAVPASKDASVGSGQVYQWASEEISGLSPQTTYHFRVVAESEAGTTTGPDRSFTTPAPAPPCPNQGMLGTNRLPDCRAYELVSPQEKNGGDVVAMSTRTQVSADGDSISFASRAAFADPKTAPLSSQFLAHRTAQPGTSGWSSHSIVPLGNAATELGFQIATPHYVGPYTPDLSSGIFTSWRPIMDIPGVETIPNLYRIDGLDTGQLTPTLLSDSFNPVPKFEFEGKSFEILKLTFEPHIVGASADLSHVVFSQKWNLTPDTPSQGPEFPGTGKNFCELVGAVCQYRLYDSVNGTVHFVGRIPQGSASQCDDETGPVCEDAPDAAEAIGGMGSHKTVSTDGSRILFQANGNIFIRDNDMRTLKVNASEKSLPDSAEGAQAYDVTPDVMRVFFTTSEELVDSDKDNQPDLYMYDLAEPEGHRLTLISQGKADVTGVIGASDDGHYVYFGATQMVSGQPHLPQPVGLSVWHDGEVAYLGSVETAGQIDGNSYRGTRNANIGGSFRIAAQGHKFLMKIGESLSGLVGRGGLLQSETEKEGRFFLYDADTGRLRCATCNRRDPLEQGAPPTLGASELGGVAPETQSLPNSFSKDGRFVFFNSQEALVPGDTNGVTDAYEYNTETEQTSLLSSGTDKDPSYFIGASADGRDAFFVTLERLSEWDSDTSYDLYDARIDGGVPEPPPVTAPCNGEACRTGVKQISSPGPIASDQPGEGNPPRTCPRGTRKVKRHGKVRCVRKPTKRHHSHSKHGKHERAADTDRRAAK